MRYESVQVHVFPMLQRSFVIKDNFFIFNFFIVNFFELEMFFLLEAFWTQMMEMNESMDYISLDYPIP